jgi:hypothetical protein
MDNAPLSTPPLGGQLEGGMDGQEHPFAATPRPSSTVVLLACGCALGLLACGPSHREVWFTPDLASRDMTDLFTHPELWSVARSLTSVFEFYEQQVLAVDSKDCPECGPNVLPNFVAAGAFEALRSWGVSVAVEVPVLKDWSCTGAASTFLAGEALDDLNRVGGDVRSIAMDEPYLGGRRCGLPTADAVARTAIFVQAIRAHYPAVQVGDIEPYPTLEPAALARWLVSLRLAGIPPAFFHVDVDRVEVRRLGLEVGRDLRPVQALCEAQGIPFGIIVWGEDGSSDEAYYHDARGWFDQMTQTFGTPDHTIFQSWAVSSNGHQETPSNLPESDPGHFTHTRLIRDSLSLSGP